MTTRILRGAASRPARISLPHARPRSLGRRALHIVLAATSVLATGAIAPAVAQTTGQGTLPPVRESVDQNGVDVISGVFIPPAQTTLSIGPADHHGLSLRRIPGGISSLQSAMRDNGGTVVVTVGTSSDSFTLSGGGYVATEGNGATLVKAGGTYIYTARDGTEARFAGNSGYQYPFFEGEMARLGSIKYPDGTLETINQKVLTYCPAGYDTPRSPCNGPLYYASRVQSITNSNGYQLKVLYASNATKLDDTNYAVWTTSSTSLRSTMRSRRVVQPPTPAR